jgi:hypothetical protein
LILFSGSLGVKANAQSKPRSSNKRSAGGVKNA